VGRASRVSRTGSGRKPGDSQITPEQDIEMFLRRQASAESRRLDIAIHFARSMVTEMRECTAKWEATEKALEDAKLRRQSVNAN
jgi:hypothetical protein